MRSWRLRVAGLAIVPGLFFIACSGGQREVILASTTSTEDSGLFEYLLPEFQRAYPRYRVRVIAVGSGEALRLGARGDADVLLTHSPRAEEAFMAEGHGESRRPVMYNDFVIVGPAADPAAVAGLNDAAVALARIEAAGAPFVSRGDDSGTHVKERELWAAAGLKPGGAGYVEAGQGMGAVLMMASEKRAYTLTDRGTYLSMADGLDLSVLVEGDRRLRNRYAVMVVKGAGNLEGARAFADWLTSPAARALIGQFGVERFGRPLFNVEGG